MGTQPWGKEAATRPPSNVSLRTFSAEPWGACSFTRHSSMAAGQQDAWAVPSGLVVQPPGLLPGPSTGLPPSPSAATGEWKLQPAQRQDVGAALRDVPTELRTPRTHNCFEVLPVTTWSCGEQPAPSSPCELVLSRHWVWGHVQHLAMA